MKRGQQTQSVSSELRLGSEIQIARMEDITIRYRPGGDTGTKTYLYLGLLNTATNAPSLMGRGVEISRSAGSSWNKADTSEKCRKHLKYDN
ncbi:MAG: hypothetical protein JKX72_01760 [Robiginitomaculum sp.]|nr:hypothetical protein [Robiginitomaculum sp.]MBN4051729.1 hypothetical protein [Parvibaculum lavamentivorans]